MRCTIAAERCQSAQLICLLCVFARLRFACCKELERKVSTIRHIQGDEAVEAHIGDSASV